MTTERMAKLSELSFEWEATNPKNVPWEHRYNELLEFVVRFAAFCLFFIRSKSNQSHRFDLTLILSVPIGYITSFPPQKKHGHGKPDDCLPSGPYQVPCTYLSSSLVLSAANVPMRWKENVQLSNWVKIYS